MLTLRKHIMLSVTFCIVIITKASAVLFVFGYNFGLDNTGAGVKLFSPNYWRTLEC
jgi:hypothetical protein